MSHARVSRQQALLTAINLIADPRERVMQLRLATASYPGYPFFWLNYASALLQLHRKEEAHDAVNRALNLDFPIDKLQPELRSLVHVPSALDVTTAQQPYVGRFQTKQTLLETASHRLMVAFDADGEVLLRSHPDLPAALAEQRFLREQEFSKKFADRIPDCAQVLEVIKDAQGVPVQVLRFVHGLEPIHQVRAHGLFGIGDVVRLLRGLADLCTKLHSYGVIHGDLRADYILCDRSDLGRQRILLLGTPENKQGRISPPDGLGPERLAWLPTEHHLSLPFDPRTDVSGLGMILYYLLAGRPPPSLRQRLIPRVPSVMTQNGAEPDLDALIWRCLAVYPQHRPESAAAFERELAGSLSQRRGALLGETTLRVSTIDPADEQQDLCGRVLGNWRLGRRLDVAVVGEVYEAENVHMTAERALVHTLPLGDAAEKASQLLQTVKELSANNLHVLNIREYARTAEGISYWVFSPPRAEPDGGLSQAKSLLDLRRDSGPMPLARAALLLIHLARAITPLHLSRRMHGELCPTNLLVLAADRPTEDLRLLGIGDGLARILLGDRAPPLSKYHCRAPEQMREGAGAVDERADLYALGMILLFCLAQEGASAYDLAQREEEMRKLPAPVVALLRRLLSERPADRPHILEVVPLLEQLTAAPLPAEEAQQRRIVRLSTIPKGAQLRRLVRAPQVVVPKIFKRLGRRVPRGHIQRLDTPRSQPPPVPSPPRAKWRLPVIGLAVGAALLVVLRSAWPPPPPPPPPLAPQATVKPTVENPPERGARVVYPVPLPKEGRPDRCNFGAPRPGNRPEECFQGHCGIDIFRPEGTPVFALSDGIVEKAVRDDQEFVARGIYLQILSLNGATRVFYLHLRKISDSIHSGSPVKAGDQIGEVGTTGVFSAPAHLHISATIKESDRVWRYHDLCAVLASAVPSDP